MSCSEVLVGRILPENCLLSEFCLLAACQSQVRDLWISVDSKKIEAGAEDHLSAHLVMPDHDSVSAAIYLCLEEV